jgi:hypothetical protein
MIGFDHGKFARTNKPIRNLRAEKESIQTVGVSFTPNVSPIRLTGVFQDLNKSMYNEPKTNKVKLKYEILR